MERCQLICNAEGDLCYRVVGGTRKGVPCCVFHLDRPSKGYTKEEFFALSKK